MPDKTRIKTRAKKINDALLEGAQPEDKFKGWRQEDLDRELTELETDEQLRARKKAELDLLDERINDKYEKVDDMCVDIGKGVAGHENYGSDSPLYGAMGFTRDSDRKSGLTRKSDDDSQ